MAVSGHVIFCEDIRYEEGQSASYIGVRGGGLELEQLPGVLPKLGIVIGLAGVERADFLKASIEVWVPWNQKPEIVAPVDTPVVRELGSGETPVRYEVTVHILAPLFKVLEAGPVMIKLNNGGERSDIGMLFLGPAVTGSSGSTK